MKKKTLGIALALLMLSTPVAAQRKTAAAASAKAIKIIKATVFYIPAKGYSAKSVARVSRRFNKALLANPHLEVKDSDKLLAEFAGEVPSSELAAAKQAQQEGSKLLIEGQVRLALAKLREAAEKYEGLVAFAKKRDLAACHLAIAVAEARSGKKRLARASFLRLLTWRPMVRYPVALYGAREAKLFERAKRRMARAKRGSVELKSDPPGAKAYVDGRFAGITPTVAFGLTAGDHYATFKLSGYIKGAAKITVSSRKQLSFSTELKRSEKFLILQQTLRKARESLGSPKANAAMVDLRSVLFVDQVIFTTIGYAGPERMKIEAFLYDLRSKLRLNQSKITINKGELNRLEELARLLYLNVRYDGTIEAPPEAPPPPPKRRRAFYATWWFWTAVAAGAAAVVVPIAVWPEAKTCPSGNHCLRMQN